MNENNPSNIATQAQHCLVTGQFERAIELYEELCSLDSENEVMWLMLAVAQAETGVLEDAMRSADRAIALDQEYTEAYLTRAHILKKLGQDAAALQSALDAVEIDDEYTDAWLFLAGFAGQLNKPADAAAWASKAVELAPENADAHVNLANAQYELGKFKDASNNYQQALQLQPNGYQAALGQAKTFLALKEFDKAEKTIADLLQRNAKDPEALNCLALLHINQDSPHKAFILLKQLIEMQPQFKPAYLLLARLHFHQKNLDEAINCLVSARTQFPDQADVLYALGFAYREDGRHTLALECFGSILAIDPDNHEMRFIYGNSIADTGDFENALSQFEILEKEYPEDNRATIARANLLDKLGDYETAYKLLLPVIETGYPPPVAANAFGQICHHFCDSDRGISLLESALQNTNLTNPERRELLFTLGKLYDRQGNYDTAFECFHKGNDLKPCSYDHDGATQFTDRLIAFSSDTLLRHAQSTKTDDEPFVPVFIVGMPRSGTSLVEQIIASHPHVAGMGERAELTEIVDRLPKAISEIGTYPECMANLPEQVFQQAKRYYIDTMKTLANGASFITDKMPSNFQHLPLILRLFPNARIIHCRRNPLDTCLSIYFQDFGGYHSYAYQLDSLGKYYREYERLIRHYRDNIRIPMLEVIYEDLVQDPERISREMITYCGLKWDDACLTHHHSERITRTASYNQVRQPVYKNSMERWKHYDKHLGALKSALESSN